MSVTNAGLKTQGSQIKFRRAPIESWSIAAAVLLTTFYLAASLYDATHHALELDELLTAFVTHLPGLAAVWKIGTYLDATPPLYDTIVWAFNHLVDNRDLAARLPSALGWATGLLLIFDSVRRLTNGLHGLLALACLTCTALPWYGHYARSYALVFMLVSLALWIWTRPKGELPYAEVLYGIVVFLAVSLHYYAALILVPHAIYELRHWRPVRLPSGDLIAGALGAFSAVALLWTRLQSARLFFPAKGGDPAALERTLSVHHFISVFSRLFPMNGPTTLKGTFSVDHLFDEFSELFPNGLFLVALIILWISFAGGSQRAINLRSMQRGERLGWLFICIPLAGFVLGPVSHVYATRYFLPTLPGIAIALACWFWRHHAEQLRVTGGVLVLLVSWGVVREVRAAYAPRAADTVTANLLSLEKPLRESGKQFIAIPNLSLYLAAQHYSKQADQWAYVAFGPGEGVRPLPRRWDLKQLREHGSETAYVEFAPGVSGEDSFAYHSGRIESAGLRTTRVPVDGMFKILYLTPSGSSPSSPAR